MKATLMKGKEVPLGRLDRFSSKREYLEVFTTLSSKSNALSGNKKWGLMQVHQPPFLKSDGIRLLFVDSHFVEINVGSCIECLKFSASEEYPTLDCAQRASKFLADFFVLIALVGHPERNSEVIW